MKNQYRNKMLEALDPEGPTGELPEDLKFWMRLMKYRNKKAKMELQTIQSLGGLEAAKKYWGIEEIK